MSTPCPEKINSEGAQNNVHCFGLAFFWAQGIQSLPEKKTACLLPSGSFSATPTGSGLAHFCRFRLARRQQNVAVLTAAVVEVFFWFWSKEVHFFVKQCSLHLDN